MGYIAIKGGTTAIREAERLLDVLRTDGAGDGEEPLSLNAVRHQLHFLHSQVLSEGGLYDPDLAALALKQSMGDVLEASFHLRAFRGTRPRITTAPVQTSDKMRLIRRISSAFKEIPGGQILGPTPDYTHRLLDFEQMEETPAAFRRLFDDWQLDVEPDDTVTTIPKVIDFLRAEGLVEEPAPLTDDVPYDITREPIVFPLPRSAALSILSRGHRGSLLALAYSNMRGFGGVHPTVAELRVGYLPVTIPHPVTGEPQEVGEVLMTECELLTGQRRGPDGVPKLTLGYAACFGHNEVKAISMAMLDRGIQNGKKSGMGLKNPSEDEEFVLLHVDGVDSSGFCIHYKMPHYVTFQAGLDRLREQKSRQKPAPATEPMPVAVDLKAASMNGSGSNGSGTHEPDTTPVEITKKKEEEGVTSWTFS